MSPSPPPVLMIGTGEYTTGYVASTGKGSTSDKKIGVVALTLFDLRRRGLVGALSMSGVSGKKFPAIRSHLQNNISKVYNDIDVSFQSYPADDKTDPESYKAAIDSLEKGSAVTIFTPDSTHFDIAMYAITRGMHVLVTKPAVKTLQHHLELLTAARKHNVLVWVEHHKRFDPAYLDAKFKAPSLGDFNYWYSYMSQPKSQLATFTAWAGKESDISYYLNSHHIDICEWIVTSQGWRPVSVRASASSGIAEDLGCVPGTEDTITLMVDWTKPETNKRATGIYTASWSAPMNAGVHSQQRFHYIASNGEINIDQAKRGYAVLSDTYPSSTPEADVGPKFYNPFYMRYAPDEEGNFAGQSGYGYVSFEKFVDNVRRINEGKIQVGDVDGKGLPTLGNTVLTTAILEAGRRSLDDGGKSVEILGEGENVQLR